MQINVNLQTPNTPTIQASSTTGTTSGASSEININDILERLQEGDLTALAELDKFRVSYIQAENDYGGTVIKFKYEGINYTITCYPESSNNVDNEESTPSNGVSQPSDSETEQAGFSAYYELYLYATDIEQEVLDKLGLTADQFQANCGKSYSVIKHYVATSHQQDFASVTKEQLFNEIVSEYYNYAQKVNPDSAQENNTEKFSSFKELQEYISSQEFKDSLLEQVTLDTIKNLGAGYSEIANQILYLHSSDFSTISKADIVNEFTSAINNYKESSDLTTKLNNAVNEIVKDFKANYTNYGLKTAPTTEEVRIFREVLLNIINVNQDDLNTIEKTDEAITNWVKSLSRAASARIQIDREFNKEPSSTTTFNSYDELKSYLNSEEFRSAFLEELGMNAQEFVQQGGNAATSMINNMIASHANDYNSVTKEDLINELITEFKNFQADLELQQKVNKYIDIWVADFIEGYDRWNLTTPPTEEEIALFRNRLTDNCNNNMDSLKNLDDTSDTEVKKWVKRQCDSVIEEILNNRNNSKPSYINGNTDYSDITKNILGALEKSEMKDLGKIICGYENIHTEFGMDSDGNIVFQEDSTTEVYNALFNSIKTRITELENGSEILQKLGGEDVLKQLVQNAWINSYSDFNSSQSNNTTKFVQKVFDNLEKIMNSIAENPENLAIYTTRSCYADSTLTEGLIHYGTKTTYDNDERIYYRNGNITNDVIHLKDKNDDEDYQTTMNALMERIKQKYPNLDEQQLSKIFNQAKIDAISILCSNDKDCPYGTGNNSGRVEDTDKNWGGNDNRNGDKGYIDMDQLVQLTLYCFDKRLIEKVSDGSVTASSNNSGNGAPPINSTNPTVNSAQNLEQLIPEIKNKNLSEIVGENSTIHTEFGINTVNGNIVFQEQSTTLVFNRLCSIVDQQLQSICDPTVYSQFGGSATVNKLVQAAWITTYNSYDSSQSNNAAAFVSKVLDNLQKMMQALQKDSSLLEIFTRDASYADSTLTEDLVHYNTKTTHGGDEAVSYAGTPTIDSDGTVHLANSKDDPDYQTTMSSLLYSLKEKYPELDSNLITSVFRDAQKQAIEALQGKRKDCPYGTGYNAGRVEDSSKNWQGRDDRNDDKNYIDMDQLVQMTLYYFDKLLYQELIS